MNSFTDKENTMESERQEQLQVTAVFEPQPEEDSRSWLVTLQTLVSEKPVDMKNVLVDIELSSSDPSVQVTILGPDDPSTCLYSVQEKEREVGESRSEPRLEVLAIPKYQDDVTRFYKLDPGLASLVGHEMLQAPKYILTCLHGYAKKNQLFRQKTIHMQEYGKYGTYNTINVIKCDKILFNIFKKRFLHIHPLYNSLWEEVSKHLRKVELKSISMSHRLSELPKSSSSQLRIKIDDNFNIYPEDWKAVKKSTNIRSRTKSLCPETKVEDKRSSLKRMKTFQL